MWPELATIKSLEYADRGARGAGASKRISMMFGKEQHVPAAGCFRPTGRLMMNLRAPPHRARSGPAGENPVMQQQGLNGMGGPLRGTSVWWHGRSQETQSSVSEEPCNPCSKRQYEKDPTI